MVILQKSTLRKTTKRRRERGQLAIPVGGRKMGNRSFSWKTGKINELFVGKFDKNVGKFDIIVGKFD